MHILADELLELVAGAYVYSYAVQGGTRWDNTTTGQRCSDSSSYTYMMNNNYPGVGTYMYYCPNGPMGTAYNMYGGVYSAWDPF